jgi:hypothetical protein
MAAKVIPSVFIFTIVGSISSIGTKYYLYVTSENICVKLQRSNIASQHKLGQVRMRGRRLVKKSNADPCVKSNSVRQKSVREKEEPSLVFFNGDSCQ